MTMTEWSPAEIATLGNTNNPKPHQPTTDRPHSWQPVDLLAAALNPPAPPSIEGIVYPGRRHVFSGEPESLKSWALMCLYVAEMRKGRAVVHVDLEMGRFEIYERLTQLGASIDDLTERFALIEPHEPILSPHVMEYMRALTELRQPSVIGIDAYTGILSLHGIDPNDNAAIDRFDRQVVHELRAHGAGVILLDHLPKSREGRGKYSIGGERKIGVTDVHLGFTMDRTFGRGQSGRAKIVVHKDRGGFLPRDEDVFLDLRSDPKTNAITYAWHFEERVVHITGKFRPTFYMEKASRYVSECAQPPTQSDTEAAVGGKREWARAGIELLVRDGFLRVAKSERNERVLKHVKSYHENADPASDKYVAPHAEPPAFEGDEDIPF